MPRIVSLLLLSVASPALATDVMLIYSVPSPIYAQDVVTKIQQTGRFANVDAWDASISTPTTNDLRGYDAVMIMPDSGFADGATLGNNLAQYVDNGGGVVDSVFSVNWGQTYISGNWFANQYRPFEGTTQGNLNGRLVPDLPNHPMLTGIRSFRFNASGYYGPDVQLARGATLVASWDNGVPLLAAHAPTNSGVVVGLNAYMPSSDAAGFGWDATGDGAELMANALEYAAGGGGVPIQTSALGVCPGNVIFSVTSASPRGDVAFVSGRAGGNFTIPGGPCRGTRLPIGNPNLRATRVADAAGDVSMAVNLPGGCGGTYLALDLTTCTPSAPATLP